MKIENLNPKAFTKVLFDLRVLSNDMRKTTHQKIINWVDEYPKPDGTVGLALTMVLPTRGCKYAMAKHGGCSMCTLPKDNPLETSDETLEKFPEMIMKLFNDKGGTEKFSAVKFYTSGSFLDRWELPASIQQKIISDFSNIVEEITIETRCEYVNNKNLQNLLDVIAPEKLIIAIGQETTDDEVNKRSINKGHTFKQFKRAVNILQQFNIQVKAYILLKSIFMSELNAFEDLKQSVLDMKEVRVDHVSINPCYIGKATLMDKLFMYKRYRPPWLWTVLYSTIFAKKILGKNVRVICDPVAAGSERGPRNCGSCDKRIKSNLKLFSSTQDLSVIIEEDCSCKEIYRSSIVVENLYDGMGVYGEFPLSNRLYRK